MEINKLLLAFVTSLETKLSQLKKHCGSMIAQENAIKDDAERVKDGLAGFNGRSISYLIDKAKRIEKLKANCSHHEVTKALPDIMDRFDRIL